MDCVSLFETVADVCFEYASVVLLSIHGVRDTGRDDLEVVATPYENAGFFDEAWIDSYASRGHKFFQRVWLFYLQHQDGLPFSLWRAGEPHELVEATDA